MKSTAVNIYDVKVTFNAAAGTEADRFSYTGDVRLGGNAIPIAPGIQMINFELLTEGGDGSAATFQAYPVTWVGTPALQPVAGLGEWFGATHCHMVVCNFNTSDVPVVNGFVLTVMYGGVSYTSPDPTIINDPPVGMEWPGVSPQS
jgi:hypothetical protein